jgi:2-octaprenylphenol hydroxylase
MPAPEFDVVIVGGGIAGAALARALDGSGLTLALVEARPLPREDFTAPGAARSVDDFDPRVSAITPSSQGLIDRLGAWQDLVGGRLCPYRAMEVWDADGTGRIDFDAAEVDAPLLGHIIENRLITSALLQGLHRRPDVTVFDGVKLADLGLADGESAALELEDGARLTARLLVAADGALSPVRRLAGFRTREWDYGHHALVATVETEKPHGGCAYQRFLDTGPLAFLPLPAAGGHHYCSIVWSAESATAEQLMALEDAAFGDALGDALELRLGAVLSVSRRFSFPLRQRHATDYVKRRVALVGDAAHTIHPLAGQGINLGLKDVEALAGVVLAAARRGADPGDLDVLSRYQRQRKGENLLMMAAMDGFKRLFGERRLPVRWLRNQGMQWVARSGPLKHQLMRHAMGVG